jgi:hypothetical protein
LLLLLDYDDETTGDGLAVKMQRYNNRKEADRKGEMASPDMTTPHVYHPCLHWKT